MINTPDVSYTLIEILFYKKAEILFFQNKKTERKIHCQCGLNSDFMQIPTFMLFPEVIYTLQELSICFPLYIKVNKKAKTQKKGKNPLLEWLVFIALSK